MRALRVVAAGVLIALTGASTARATFPGGDGRLAIAFSSDVNNVPPEPLGSVFTFDASGVNRRRGPEGDDPVWSPDGRRLALINGYVDEFGVAHTAIAITRPNGSHLRRVHLRPTQEGPTGPYQASWAPDGRHLVFTEAVKGGIEPYDGLFTVKVDGSQERTVIAPSKTNPPAEATWAPDGSEIAFVDNQRTLEAIHPNSSLHRVIYGLGIATVPSAPSWSPDSRQIAFSARPGAGSTNDVMVINRDGTNPRVIAEGITPVWSPDGTQIAFIAISGMTTQIEVVNVDGSNRRALPLRYPTPRDFPISLDWQPLR